MTMGGNDIPWKTQVKKHVQYVQNKERGVKEMN